jgi:iron complex outermembrane receptor protein
MKAKLIWTVSAIAMAMPSIAWGQSSEKKNEDSGDAKDPIIVTAARGQGTRDARVQRLQMVDAIGLKDIDSLPSQNIADVLKRLAGVQVTYDNGEAQQPNIRGVQFIQTTIDGREVATANTRSLQIGDIPGDVVNGVAVYKSQSADMIEGGIGGLIAVTTKQPLSYDKLSVTGQLSMSIDGKRGKARPQGAVTAGASWDTSVGRMGLSIGYAHTEVVLRSDFFISNYSTSNSLFDVNKNGTTGDAADTAIVPSLALPIQINTRHSRDSLVGTFQWAPSEELEVTSSIFHSAYLDQAQQYSLIATPGSSNSSEFASNFTLAPNSPVDLPLVQSGTYANGSLTTQSLYVRPFRSVWQQSLALKWERDAIKISAQGDFTQSENNNDILIFAARRSVPTFNYAGVNSPKRGTISFPGANITDATAYGSMTYLEIVPRAESDANTQRIDFAYDGGDSVLKGLQFGARRAQRTSTANQVFAFNNVPGDLSSIPGLATPSPDGDFVSANPLLFIDKSKFRSLIGLPTSLPPNSPGSFFKLNETTYAGYGRALYQFNLGGVRIDGDIGVRMVHSKNTGSAFEISQAGNKLITATGSTTDWLPSGTLRALLTDRLTLRFTASKTMARPSFGELSPGLTLNPGLTGFGGNPNLRSFYATGVDAGLDWMFSPSGYTTIAVFKKSLKGLIANVVNPESIDGTTYQITRPVNGASDASYVGFELNVNKKFVELPGLLSGIGVDANYTYLKSELTNESGVKTRIQGLATHTVNGSIYYDRGPVLLRVGYAFTSNFVNNPNFGGVPQLGGQEIFGSQEVLDATAQIRVMDHLRLTANIMNALQPDVGYYNGFKQTPNNSYRTYRRMQFGMKFEF